MAEWKLLGEYLSQVPTTVTLSWTELDSIVDGLPTSASKFRAWWSGDRSHVNAWKSAGFVVQDLNMGSRVTFVRKGLSFSAPIAKKESAPETQQLKNSMGEKVGRIHADIILVSCVKTKRSESAAAKDLYISDLFLKERSYAESTGQPWYILSAEHGLVLPDQKLDPYERYLPKESASYRRTWGLRVIEQLKQISGSLGDKVIEVHAGAVYLEAIQSGLESHGAKVIAAWGGKSFGQILKWYADGARREGEGTTNGPGTDLQDAGKLVESLLRESEALSPLEFLATRSTGLKVPGLYSWWVDDAGASDLTSGLGYLIRPGLIYAGLAGATHWPSGKRSTNTLWLRIATMHLGKKIQFSTFRLTLGAILANEVGRNEVDEEGLSIWMEAHLRVVAVPFEDADSLGEVETKVLEKLDPPLNLMGMPITEIRTRLKELRRVVAR